MIVKLENINNIILIGDLFVQKKKFRASKG